MSKTKYGDLISKNMVLAEINTRIDVCNQTENVIGLIILVELKRRIEKL